ncbi:MAG: winged helix-turn-helix transcriptional regulator [Candidatus Korarchaeota archaeon]|nr:winged helix-turn-helix transcriptional regulator [Candidatus Korarchaeota archaeon]
MRSRILDDRDLRILTLLSENPRIPLSSLAKLLGISHTAISRRLRRLTDSGILRQAVTLNFEKLRFKIAIMLLEVDTIKNLREIARRFEDCPRLIHLFQGRGSLNLIAVMAAENEEVLNSITGTCMIRTYKGVRRSEIVEIAEPLVNPYLPIEVPRMDMESAPCGADCSSCPRYVEESCLGCPSFVGYRKAAFAYRDGDGI